MDFKMRGNMAKGLLAVAGISSAKIAAFTIAGANQIKPNKPLKPISCSRLKVIENTGHKSNMFNIFNALRAYIAAATDCKESVP